MSSKIQQLYAHKLERLEHEFALISKAYARLAEELRLKNTLIIQLTTTIESLRQQLQELKPSSFQLQQRLMSVNTQSSQAALTASKQIKEQVQNAKERNAQLFPQKTQVLKQSSAVINKKEQPQSAKSSQKDSRFRQFQDVTAIISSKFSPSSDKERRRMDAIVRNKEETAEALELATSEPKGNGEGDRLRELQSIWEERDRQISKIDSLFSTLNEKIKDYE